MKVKKNFTRKADKREGERKMSHRTDYFHDPHAPHPNRIVPAASALLKNEQGQILLERRRDNTLWGLPGGAMELGESSGQTIIREVKEETGLEIIPNAIVGIYSNPNHSIAYSDGEVRQQFSICFACTIVGGELRVSEVEHLAMHESIRLRIHHALTCQEPIIN
jgi:8-oxo-dGTP pyrophosphatase MutT (NUDIX family)